MADYISKTVVYSDIFDDNPYSVGYYLHNIEKRWLIQTLCYIVGINTVESFSFDCENFIKMFFQDYIAEKSVQNLFYRIEELKKNMPTNVKLTFINTASSIEFIRECLIKEMKGESKDTLVDLMNVFKVYLLYSEMQVEKFQAIVNSPKNNSLRDAKLTIANGLQHYGLVEYNIVDLRHTQCAKSMALFKYLSEKEEFKFAISKFCSKYKFTSYLDFLLKAISPLTLYSPTKFKEGLLSLNKKDFENNGLALWNSLTPYFDEISIDIYNIENNKSIVSDYEDFTCFKRYPVLKLDNETYIIMSSFFYALKLYDGFRMDVKSFLGNVNSTISTEFSEQILLYKSLYNLVNPYRDVTFSGKYFDDRKETGKPDYYIRKKNQICLIEFKDMLIRKDIKDSLDIEDFIDLLADRLNKQKHGKRTKNKGIPQIIKNMEDVFSNNFLNDNYQVCNIRIYSILIIDNRLLSLNGINYILNEWFQEQIEKSSILVNRRKQIYPLLIIDFDFLLLLSNSFKHRLGELITLFHSYQKYIRNAAGTLEEYISFRNYVLNHTKALKINNKQYLEFIRKL